jgi:uncharacterized protein YndB with AHSA1/START domain
MNKNLIASSTILINSTPQKIWDVLTNPEKVKIYLFGTKIKTDWKKGNPISFEGEYQGKTYNDKGIVIDYQPLQTISYSYWNSFSGLENKTENYAIVNYKIEEQGEGIYIFTWHQQGFVSEEVKCHTEKGLIAMLEEIKKIAEE